MIRLYLCFILVPYTYPFLFDGPCIHSETSKASHKGQGNGSCYNREEKTKPKFHSRKLWVKRLKNKINIFNIEMFVHRLQSIDGNIDAVSNE